MKLVAAVDVASHDMICLKGRLIAYLSSNSVKYEPQTIGYPITELLGSPWLELFCLSLGKERFGRMPNLGLKADNVSAFQSLGHEFELNQGAGSLVASMDLLTHAVFRRNIRYHALCERFHGH